MFTMMPLLAASHDDAAALALSVPIVAILCTFAWLIVKAIMSPFNNRSDTPPPFPRPFRRMRGVPHQTVGAPTTGGLTEEEQAVLLKLQRTIGQMERRIESLETILIDNARTKENYGTKL